MKILTIQSLNITSEQTQGAERRWMELANCNTAEHVYPEHIHTGINCHNVVKISQSSQTISINGIKSVVTIIKLIDNKGNSTEINCYFK